MDTRSSPQNIQDAFLNTVRRERSTVTIYLISGTKLTGRIRSFDKFSILLESNAQEQLIFKHAISTIQHARRPSGELQRATPVGTQETAHGEQAPEQPERQES